MGIFNKIRKAFRKGGALPNEHGPAVKFASQLTDEEKTLRATKMANGPKSKASKVTKVEFIKATTDDKPATIPSEYAKAVVKKQKAASKTKPSKDAENKKPATKKAPAKKTPAKPTPKATAKKPAPKKK
jgi:hypothetical protein